MLRRPKRHWGRHPTRLSGPPGYGFRPNATGYHSSGGSLHSNRPPIRPRRLRPDSPYRGYRWDLERRPPPSVPLLDTLPLQPDRRLTRASEPVPDRRSTFRSDGRAVPKTARTAWKGKHDASRATVENRPEASFAMA